MPVRAMKPIIAMKEIVLPVSASASTPPAMPNGITLSTIRVLLKLPNSSTSTAITPSSAMMVAACRPSKLSERVSNSPPGT